MPQKLSLYKTTNLQQLLTQTYRTQKLQNPHPIILLNLKRSHLKKITLENNQSCQDLGRRINYNGRGRLEWLGSGRVRGGDRGEVYGWRDGKEVGGVRKG